MAEKTIGELDAAASAAATDMLEIETAANASKHVTAAQLLTYIEGAIGTAAFRALLDDADSTALRATLGLVIGTNVQAYDAELAALAGLTSAADKGIQFTGSGTAATYDLTAAGKALLDDAAASNQRTTLGLGTIATQDANNVTISGGAVTGITDLALADGGTGASLVDPGADRIMFWDDSAGSVAFLTPGTGLTITTTTIDAAGGSAMAYVLIQDQKAQNTTGGGFTSGAWRTRVLNTEVADTGNNASIASNQITLEAGTYRCRASAPAWFVVDHQARLQNITDGTTIAYGTTSRAESSSAAGTITRSEITTRFTLAAQKVLEVQHQCTTTSGTHGFGPPANFGTEVYTSIELWKE